MVKLGNVDRFETFVTSYFLLGSSVSMQMPSLYVYKDIALLRKKHTPMYYTTYCNPRFYVTLLKQFFVWFNENEQKNIHLGRGCLVVLH